MLGQRYVEGKTDETSVVLNERSKSRRLVMGVGGRRNAAVRGQWPIRSLASS